MFPLWMQHKFGLQQENLELLNDTLIPYPRVKIPICKLCNNQILGSIETKISKADEEGASAVRKLGVEVVGVWTAKILLGILVAESRYHLDRRDPDSPSIVASEDIEEDQLLQMIV